MSTASDALRLDCIIFGLQSNGGISNYWARLIDGLTDAQLPNWTALLPKAIRYQDFRTTWPLTGADTEAMAPFWSRYLACPVGSSTSVLHTSYYRLPSRPVKNYVVTVYDFMYERYRTGPARRIHTWQKCRSIERADTLSCISSFTRDELLEFCPRVDPKRIHVIPLGVDTDAYFPDRQAADDDLGNTVLFVGLRGGYKRFSLASEAVRAVPGLRLGIVGQPLTADETAALNLTLAGRWKHFGSVPSQRLRELYSAAHSLIFPSDCEGFGLPVLEAMACACPVVSSRRASLPEVGGNAALYAADQRADDYADALASLGSARLREHAVASGLSRVGDFSWAKTIRLTLDLYGRPR